MKIDELDVVALTTPLPNAEMYDGSEGLRVGDEGTVVGLWRENAGYIVEFFRDGETVAIEDVTPDQVRLVWKNTPTVRHDEVRVENAQREDIVSQ
jgi:hypothetical protein